MSIIPVWQRELFVPTDRTAAIDFRCLMMNHPGALELGPEHGFPDIEWPTQLHVTVANRDDDPEWVESLLGGWLFDRAAIDLGEPRARVLSKATHCLAISGDLNDRADLGYLQAAWAVARLAMDRSGLAVLDVRQGIWFDASQLRSWPADRNLDLNYEVNFVIEQDPEPDLGHIVHTRGMEKFARPDLVIPGIRRDQSSVAANLLSVLTGALTRGKHLRPGETARLGASSLLFFDEYRAGVNAPDLELNNDALLVRDAAWSRRPFTAIESYAASVDMSEPTE